MLICCAGVLSWYVMCVVPVCDTGVLHRCAVCHAGIACDIGGRKW